MKARHIVLERTPRFRGCFTLRVARHAKKRAREACFVFHGFPANRGFRNQDIAEEICWRKGSDVYLIHYAGLGKSPGKFSFVGSVRDTVKFVESVARRGKYRKVHLVGHSWGGIVAMNAARALGDRLGKLVLLAPFNFIADRDTSAKFLSVILKDAPMDYAAGDLAGVVEELQELGRENNPREIARSRIWKKDQVTIFQSLDDPEVPEFTTREFVKLFDPSPRYQEMTIDHGFLDSREHVIDLVCTSL